MTTSGGSTGARMTAWDVTDGYDLTGRCCVITGATSGLGLESARALASAGAQVVLAARNPEALDTTRAQIQNEFPAAQIFAVELDLASLQSVRAAAAAIATLATAVHVLMNNAGVMFTPQGRTADGFETQFGVNHLGHFELTRSLMPQLIAADGARVVNLASEGHRLADVDLDDPNWNRRDYNKFHAYGASKTSNILHAREVDRRYCGRGVRAYAVHPGLVATSLARHMSGEDVEAVMAMSGPVGGDLEVQTAQTGAATQVWAAVSPTLLDVGGVYLRDCTISDDYADYGKDVERAAQLWTLSERLCG